MIKESRFFIVAGLFVLAGFVVHFRGELYVPPSRPLEEMPKKHRGWEMVSNSEFGETTLQVLAPSDYLMREYADEEGNRVSWYLGYHGGGDKAGPIHSPKHCLPGGGWHPLSERQTEVRAGDTTVPLVAAFYKKVKETQLFLYWYQVMEKAITSEYTLKLLEIRNSILYNRKDAAFIRVSVPVTESREKAVAVGKKFIKDFYPLIRSFLPE